MNSCCSVLSFLILLHEDIGLFKKDNNDLLNGNLLHKKVQVGDIIFLTGMDSFGFQG